MSAGVKRLGWELPVIATAVAVTMAFGMLYKSKSGRFAPEMPVRSVPFTRASLALVEHGYDPGSLAGLSDEGGMSLAKGGIAMWCHFKIANGHRNHPIVTFELRDAEDQPFPYQLAWVRDGVYVFLPTGYSVVPKRLTFQIRQSGRTMGAVYLPKLPPPPKRTVPHLMPAWPGLTAYRVPSAATQSGTVSIFVRPSPLERHNQVIMQPHGSSVSQVEPCNIDLYAFGEQPGIADLQLNFPNSTHAIYLSFYEDRPRGGVPIRRALIAVPLDRVSHAPLPPGTSIVLPSVTPMPSTTVGPAWHFEHGAWRKGTP